MAVQPAGVQYWRGFKIRFREAVEDAAGLPLGLDTADGARIRGVYWMPKGNPMPKVAVIAAHPRVDFTEHHTFPSLLRAGYGCLGANLRSHNNDMDCLHEKLVLDIAAYMAWLREHGAEKIILLGNSGGGSLFSFYQQQAKAAPGQRISHTLGGRATGLAKAELIPGDAMIYMAAHAGQGLIINEVIDAAVTDENDPFKSDPDLDMYDPRNGFQPPPQWSRYAPEFVERYRRGQLARVGRLDARAHELIAVASDAAKRHGAEDFDDLPQARRREIMQREAFEPVMVIYRTLANLNYADNSLDPSPRAYGSLISPRPDIRNFQRAGFARVMTPEGWLSTWSGLSSNANIEKTGAAMTVPSLVIQAGRDLDVFPKAHGEKIFNAIAAGDKEFWDFPDALHYFEPDEGDTANTALDALMARLVPWVAERFPL
ncbi:MAG: hypothetical protein QF384_02960 [Alphaproteobacteria bacterium]|nr:hypothetical protein [Alphaproteobacteria bacterium]